MQMTLKADAKHLYKQNLMKDFHSPGLRDNNEISVSVSKCVVHVENT